VGDSHKKPETILRIVSEVNEAIAVSNGRLNVLTTILDTISEQFRVPCCWVQRVNPADQRLVLASHRGFTRNMIWELNTSKAGRHFNDLVSRYGHKVVIPHLSRQHEIDLKAFRMARYRALVAVPITTYRIGGILGMASYKKKRFSNDTAELLAVIAGLTGTAMEKVELYERFPSNNDKESDSGEITQPYTPPFTQSSRKPDNARLDSTIRTPQHDTFPESDVYR
jgi:GAF domain-containing protein